MNNAFVVNEGFGIGKKLIFFSFDQRINSLNDVTIFKNKDNIAHTILIVIWGIVR